MQAQREANKLDDVDKSDESEKHDFDSDKEQLDDGLATGHEETIPAAGHVAVCFVPATARCSFWHYSWPSGPKHRVRDDQEECIDMLRDMAGIKASPEIRMLDGQSELRKPRHLNRAQRRKIIPFRLSIV